DGIRAFHVTGVQTCALPILPIGGLGAGDGNLPTPLPQSGVFRVNFGQGKGDLWGTDRSQGARRTLQRTGIATGRELFALAQTHQNDTLGADSRQMMKNECAAVRTLEFLISDRRHSTVGGSVNSLCSRGQLALLIDPNGQGTSFNLFGC